MQYHDLNLTPEQGAGLATMYRRLARCVVWAGYDDPRPGWIVKAREMERAAPVHIHDSGRA